jgi:hypothetical protein
MCNPRVRQVKLESNSKEPTTLLSDGSITNFSVYNSIIAKKYLGLAVCGCLGGSVQVFSPK